MAEETEEKISRSARFYRLHREAELAKRKEEYNKRPDVIQRREEREKKRAEKEEALRLKKLEKEEKIRQRVAVAERTSKKNRSHSRLCKESQLKMFAGDKNNRWRRRQKQNKQ